MMRGGWSQQTGQERRTEDGHKRLEAGLREAPAVR